MSLLHKNLILAGIASVAMAGFLSSSSASALDGFSIFGSDAEGIDLSKFPSINWQNPWATGVDCASANPGSSVSCNMNAFPALLFNENGEDDAKWGHDGKGVVFTAGEHRVDSNPQLRTAKAGDTLSFSVKLEDTDRYYDNAETKPILFYGVFVGLSQGLTLKDMHVKVNGETLSESDYAIEVSTDVSTAANLLLGKGASGYIIDIDWADYTHSTSSGNSGYSFESFKYPEQASIEVLYTAIVDDASANTVFSRALYQVKYLQNSQYLYTAEPHGLYNGEDYRATALLHGNLIIRSENEQGAPIAGSKYIVKGVNADSDPSYMGGYIYNPNGAYTEFETNSEGQAIIENVPFGEYEVVALDGSGDTQVIAVDNETMKSVNPGMKDYYLNSLLGTNILMTEAVKDGPNGKYMASPPTTLHYNPDTERYEGDSKVTSYEAYIAKENGNYALWYKNYSGSKRAAIPATGEKTTSKTIRSKDLFSYQGEDVNSFIGGLVDNEYYSIERGADGKPIFSANYADYYDPDSGLYKMENGGYPLLISVEDEEIQVTYMDSYGIRFSYDEEKQGYYLDSNYAYFDIEEIDENTILLTENLVLTYSEKLDTYFAANAFMGGMPWQSLIITKDRSIYAASAFFSKTGEAGGLPEEITNPQTSDAVIKAAIIVTIGGLAPLFIFRKQLTKRTN